jgi:hypothetical protein
MPTPDYDKESWVELFHTAMLELTHAKMDGRISEARSSIVERMTKLQELPGLHREEIHAIQGALNQLRVLEREDRAYTADEKRRAIENAVETLISIAPRMQGPE